MPRPSNETRPAGFKRLQKKLGKGFRELREERNETKTDVAEKLGVSSMTIANWERGDSVTLYTLWAYAKHQKRPMSAILAEHAA